MKRLNHLFIVALLATFIFPAWGQISKGGIPPSNKYDGNISQGDYPIYVNWDEIRKEDKYTRENKFPTRIGINIEVKKDINEVGAWSILPDGRMMWRYELESEGARALSVLFDEFNLPSSGELFLYDSNKKLIIGAFTSDNNNDANVLSTQMLPGDKVIVEYCEKPNGVYPVDNYRSNTRLRIGTLIHIYNDGGMFNYLREEGSKPYTGESEWCEVNVNCVPEGDNWQIKKKGIVAMVMPMGNSAYLCSGSMVNDAINSGIQYLLSAFHCVDEASPSDFVNFQFYFNYERPGCSNDQPPIVNQMISGCEFVSGSDAKKRGTDHLLLRLNNTPPQAWNVYYNGWTLSTEPSASGVGIHHPAGDVKKISTYTIPLTSGTFNNGMTGAFWSVKWSQTPNGFGVTEGGSSGSPLFNTEGLIVGTLSGGASFCEETNGRDLYGKMDMHWTANGESAAAQLKPWLDPLNSGVTSVNGTFPNEIAVAPVADFRYEQNLVPAYNNVRFYDMSSNIPTSWEWTFEGATPSSSTERNPSVIYSKPGTYSVTLKVTNANGEDSEVKTDYISIVPYEGTDIVIGTNSKNNSSYPLGGTSKYERSASIYTKDEIGSKGTIKTLSWFTSATKKTKIIKIYLKHTTSITFSANGNTCDEMIENATLVFDGIVETSNNNWTNIELNRTFEYNGEENLIVFVEQNDSKAGSTKCLYTNKTAKHQIWESGDQIPNWNGTRDNARPNIKIGAFIHNETPQIYIDRSVVLFDGTTKEAKVEVTPNTLSHTVTYKTDDTEAWVESVSAIGAYDVKVSVTGDDVYNYITLVREKALIITKDVSVSETADTDIIKAYPNPAKDYITVSGDNIAEVAIFDINGRYIKSYNNTNKIDISYLNSGIYTITVKNNDGITKQIKIVVSK